MKKISRFSFLLTIFLILTGCSGFTGIREPLYDGRPIQRDEEAIETYNTSGEIIGEEKDYYFRYSFSEDIYNPSLDFLNQEPFLLRDGEYVIGEDVQPGRVTLFGNQSVFTSENYDVHLGNFIIRDEEGEIYFENLFHAAYGQLVAQVDFIQGHTIEIIGREPEITVFYSEQLPEDPYILMDPPQLLSNLDQLSVQQPIRRMENNTIGLTAGIYEVGTHFEAGTYEILDFYAVHSTAIYLFNDEKDPRVFELVVDQEKTPEELELENNLQIEFQEDEKIYLELISSLVLQRVENDE